VGVNRDRLKSGQWVRLPFWAKSVRIFSNAHRQKNKASEPNSSYINY